MNRVPVIQNRGNTKEKQIKIEALRVRREEARDIPRPYGPRDVYGGIPPF